MHRPGRPCLTSIREIRKVRRGECVYQRRSATKSPSGNMSATAQAGVESPFAWLRLLVVVVLGTVGNVAMWSVPVVLPAVQTQFGVALADASLSYAVMMLVLAFGCVVIG